ncbi:CvpA family protein [Pseudolactococcus yaeyamensis]
MIITILILATLVWTYLVGQSRGLALQGFYTLGTLAAIFVALTNYEQLGKKITLWVPFASATSDSKLTFYTAKLLFEVDHVFYATLAFMAIFLLVYGIVRVIGIFLGALENKIILGKTGNILAGALAVCCAYFILSLGLMILSTIPIPLVQNQLMGSGLARFMLVNTPFFSGWLQETFITQVTHIKV